MRSNSASNRLWTRRRVLGGTAALAGAAAFGGLTRTSGRAQTALRVLAPRITFAEATESQIASFKELTGMDVTFDIFAEPEAQQKNTVELAAGTGAYDVVWTGSNQIPQYAQAGWLESLEPFIAEEDPAELNLEDFIQPLLEAGRRDGELYGLPVFIGTQLFYYRTDVVSAAPDTFEALLATAKEVHGNPVPGFAIRGGRGRDLALWPFPLFMLGFGGKWFADFPNDMHPTLDSPEVIQAAEYWVDLLGNYGIPNIASANFDEVLNAVAQGQTAMAIEGAPLAARLYDPEQSQVSDKLGMALVPQGPAGRFPPFAPHHWAIPTSARDKDASWQFIKWALSAETQLQGALATNHIAVSRRSVWENPEFKTKYDYSGDGRFAQLFLDSALAATTTYRPPVPEWAQLGDRLSIGLNEALTGQKSASEAMQEVQKDMTDLFQRAGYY